MKVQEAIQTIETPGGYKFVDRRHTTNAHYESTDIVSDDGLFTRWLTNEKGCRVCKAKFMLDHNGDAVVVQLDTPKTYRGNGYARKLLAQIHMRETSGNLMVLANAHAAPYYEKLGYTEVAPYVFQV